MRNSKVTLLSCVMAVVIGSTACSNSTESLPSDSTVTTSIVVEDTTTASSSAASSETTVAPTTASTTSAVPAVAAPTSYDQGLYNSYYSALIGVVEDRETPWFMEDQDRIELADDGTYAIDNSSFAVCDIDMDGTDELLLYWENGADVENTLIVMEFDTSTGDWHREITCPLGSTFYDNGVVIEPLSHNQGLGETVWPYYISEYDSSSGIFEHTGYIDSMEESVCDRAGVEFPSSYDTDGRGIVYMVEYSGYSGAYEYSQSSYDSFVSSLTGGASRLLVETHSLSWENMEEYLLG